MRVPLSRSQVNVLIKAARRTLQGEIAAGFSLTERKQLLRSVDALREERDRGKRAQRA